MPDSILLDNIVIDKKTVEQLLKALDHSYVSPELDRVHELIKRMWEFTSEK